MLTADIPGKSWSGGELYETTEYKNFMFPLWRTKLSYRFSIHKIINVLALI